MNIHSNSKARPRGATGSSQRLTAIERLVQELTARVDTLESALCRHLDVMEGFGTSLEGIEEVLKSSRAGMPELPAYQRLVRRIHEAARRFIPRGSIVIVVSKGDSRLAALGGRTGWHFPQQADGTYSGYYPECDLSAIAHLEALRAKGAGFLLCPETAFWWLDHYTGFKRHLQHSYRLLAHIEDTCRIYALQEPAQSGTLGVATQFGRMIAQFRARFDREPTVLDCHTGLNLTEKFPELTVFQPPVRTGNLPYLDGTVDVVVANASDSEFAAEARRVARAVRVSVPEERNGEQPIETHWMLEVEENRPLEASIIVPFEGGHESVRACLRALESTLPIEFPCEILLMNDSSGEAVQELLEAWSAHNSRARVLRNRTRLGFAKSCNLAARDARADTLVFLSPDAVLLPNWLSPLLRTFREYPDAGAVGGKLLHPDGTLQEAGGVLFADGSAAAFGCGDTNPENPAYDFVREVDYCSHALLATRRTLWEQLHGFNVRQFRGTYEAIDYCLRIREANHRVYYQPECAAVSQPGDSVGHDPGGEPAETATREAFLKRWKNHVQTRPRRPELLLPETWHHAGMAIPATCEDRVV